MRLLLRTCSDIRIFLFFYCSYPALFFFDSRRTICPVESSPRIMKFEEKKSKKLRVTFLHPDLGIGGAERLVVDAALALQHKGHDVDIVTSHHDPKHCFTETKDGTFRVTVVGDWLPRHIFGKFFAVFAYLRMVSINQ